MFTEVKEMIDSTIYENGKGEVTAQNVNLAMHGIVDAAEEVVSTLDGKLNTETSNREALEERVTAIEENGTGGGSQPIVVYMGIPEETEDGYVFSLTADEKSNNAEAFKAIKESRGRATVVFDISKQVEVGTEVIDFASTMLVSMIEYEHVNTGGQEQEIIALGVFAESMFLITPDGSIIIAG